MDNASNNDAAMMELHKILRKKGITFDAMDRRIRCYPHIIHICVSHVVKSAAKVSIRDIFDGSQSDDEESDGYEVGYNGDRDGDAGDSDADEDDAQIMGLYEREENLSAWFKAVKQDPINKARQVVRKVRSSGQRREAFRMTISLGNKTQAFKDENGNIVQVNELQLLPDVKHRWDSLFLMLHCLKELKPVRDHHLLL
jgi:hypothetical protein